MIEVPHVDFIRPCGVVVFAMFYCLLTCVVVSVCWLSAVLVFFYLCVCLFGVFYV